MELPDMGNVHMDDDYEAKFAGYRVDCNDGKGDPLSCHMMGEYYATVKREYENAAKIYEQNCTENGYGASCFSMARFHLAGRGVPKSEKRGMDYLEKACGLKNMPSCLGLAGMLYYSRHLHESDRKPAVLEENKKKAVQLYEENCKSGCFESCAFSGMYLLAKTTPERDPVRAIPYLTTACDGKEPKACYNLAVLYKFGDVGVGKDKEKFEHYKTITEDLLRARGDLH